MNLSRRPALRKVIEAFDVGGIWMNRPWLYVWEIVHLFDDDRPHLALGKDAPNHRPIQRQGPIMARPIMGGLHHCYARI